MEDKDIKTPGPTDYASAAVPAGYVCGTCGASGVKLWRLYQTFLSHQELACAGCAAAAEGCSIADIDADGRRMETGAGFAPDPKYRTDQIGWRIPAVPTEEGDTYWGYTSVPPAGVTWWRRLPTLSRAT
jgi:hypothetical protein